MTEDDNEVDNDSRSNFNWKIGVAIEKDFPQTESLFAR
jgi:hypothetical protein